MVYVPLMERYSPRKSIYDLGHANKLESKSTRLDRNWVYDDCTV